MARCLRDSLLLCALLLPAPSATAAAQPVAITAPIDAPWLKAEDLDPPILWGGSWKETLESCEKAWKQELETDPEGRRRLEGREMRLLLALIDRYPVDAERRLEALRRIAGLLDAQKLHDAACEVRGRILEEHAGEDDAVLPVLEELLAVSEREAENLVDAPRWRRLAAEGILTRTVSAADRPELVELRRRALQTLFDLDLSAGRLRDALEILDGLDDSERDEITWRLLEAELDWRTGDAPAAEAKLQALLESLPADSRDRSRPDWRLRQIQETILFTSIPPAFAGDPGKVSAFEALERAPPDAAALERIARFQSEDARGQLLVPRGEDRRASLWSIALKVLGSRGEEDLADLRALHEREVLALRRREEPLPREPWLLSSGADRRMELYRRHPFSAAACEGLLDLGLAWLREGRPRLARSIFDDLCAQHVEAAVRRQALVASWIARAHLGEIEELRRGLEGIDPGALFPWLGGTAAVSEILDRLAGAAAGDGPPPLAPEPSLERLRILRLPAAPLVPVALPSDEPELIDALPLRLPPPVVAGGAVVVGSPEVIAVYGASAAEPRWVHACASPANRLRRSSWNDQPLVVPSATVPCVDDGRVFARSGLDASGRIPRSVAAFDIDDGRVLWTTESLLSWSQTWPTSDPIALEGRVYVLVAHHDEDLSQVFLPVGLAALDAPTGREIWRSHLASSRHIASTRLPRRYGDLVPIDLAHYGGSLACDGDSIYCSTSLGLVARVDARDGLIHWCRVYPRSQADPDWSRLLRRAASPPALSGDAVVFAPRDWTGALAADRETGDLLWSSRFLPSERLLGAWKDLVLLHGDGQLIALRASDGSTAWKRETSVGADERAVLSGGSIYVLGDDRIARYDAGRGSELEAPAAHRGLRALAAGDGALIALGEEPEHFAQDPPPAISAAARGRREIPLDAEFRLAVRLARPQPSLLLPPRGSPVIDRLLLLADNLLECLDGGEPGRVLWRRSVDRRFIDIGWSGRDIILIYLGSACAVCLETGATRWSARFPFAAASRAMSGRYLVLLKKRPPGVGAALIDLETGRLLWNRVLGPLFRELILHDASFEEGVIHLVGQDRDERHRERRIGTTVTLGIEDGSLLACRRYPRSALLTKADRRFVYDIDESGQPLVTTLADPPEQARFTSAAKVDFDWGRTQMAIFGEWLQVRVHFQDSRIHDYRQWIYRRGDPGYVYHLPSDGDIQGGIVHCPTVEGLEVHDLPSRRLAMKYSLPDPGRDRFHRVIGSWEDDGRVLVVASVLRGRNDREPQAIRADVFESATALHTGGRPLPDVMYWYRRADNDPLWRETQVAWRGGALYVTEPRGAAVFVPAADAEEDPGGGGAGEEQAPRLPRQDPAPLQQRRRPDRR